jgi:hypothetical protein
LEVLEGGLLGIETKSPTFVKLLRRHARRFKTQGRDGKWRGSAMSIISPARLESLHLGERFTALALRGTSMQGRLRIEIG